MRALLNRLVCLLSLLITTTASAVTMAWTPIGNPGNPADPDFYSSLCGPNSNQRCGSVAYSYSIGTYEVTNAQYAEFLNSKAASDPFELYNTSMGSPWPGAGISRSGADGAYTYSAIAGRENMPVNFVTFFDALRFSNWLNNGEGIGDTETGAYTLLGGTPTPSNGAIVTRNPDARIVLPSEDEWYKAAYYDSSSSSYFIYPAGSNTGTTCSTPTATPNHANCGGAVDPPNGLPVAVGSYPGSASPYGTYDQGGNVSEWNETINGSGRDHRGGSFAHSPFFLNSYTELQLGPDASYEFLGFRVAMVPEPSTGLLVIAGLLGLASWRRARD